MSYKKIKLKIGEFSKLCQVTVKTLRHYEKIGILKPMETDEWTGYRYYNVAQMKVMNSIQYLKQLGLSLEEIGDLFEEDRTLPDVAAIDQLLHRCDTQLRLLLRQRIELKRLKTSINTPNVMNSEVKKENLTIQSLPAITVVSFRKVISSYDELFQLCPNVIGPEMMRLGCECSEPGYCFTCEHNHQYSETNIDIEYCEQVKERKEDSDIIKFKDLPEVKQALCYKHYGPYSKFPEIWAHIYEYIEANGYNIAELPRFSYIDGVWNKADENEWLTEIQVPIEKA